MKRSIWKSRVLNSLGSVVALATLPGIAMAQTPSAASLMSGNAQLVHTINTKSAMQGQAVAVKLTGSIETPQGVKLPGGTVLMGKVDKVQAATKDGSSTLTLTFNQAQLKGGKTVAIKATVMGVSPEGRDAGSPSVVAPGATFHQSPGTIGDIALDSAVTNDVSATLTDAHHDIKLDQGTQMLVAVAVVSNQQSVNGQ